MLVVKENIKLEVFRPLEAQRFSVSKLNQMLSVYVVLVWFVLSIVSLCNTYLSKVHEVIIKALPIALFISTIVFIIITIFMTYSKEKDTESRNWKVNT